MKESNRRWYRLAIGLLAMCALLAWLEWARPGLGETPPDERRDATPLFYTELDVDPTKL